MALGAAGLATDLVEDLFGVAGLATTTGFLAVGVAAFGVAGSTIFGASGSEALEGAIARALAAGFFSVLGLGASCFFSFLLGKLIRAFHFG